MTIERNITLIDWCDIKSKQLKDFIREDNDHMFNHYTVIPLEYVLEGAAEEGAEFVEDLLSVVPEWVKTALYDEGLTQEELKNYENVKFYIDW